MSRTQRLLDLIQILRGHRYPVTGIHLAETLGISLRTLYRDIKTLQAQGANIEGEAGLGYILRPGFLLPPMMFSEEEIEAIVLGLRWVSDRGDGAIHSASRDVLSKISAVLPEDLQRSLESSTLLIGPGKVPHTDDELMLQIREAIRTEHKITIHYQDLKNNETARTIWPFAMGYFDQVRVLSAWCESRKAYRHFRTDRIHKLTIMETRYPRRRQALLKEWQELEDVIRAGSADKN